MPGPGTRLRRESHLGSTDANGCHRSDVAEAISNTIPVDEKGNLACSGCRHGEHLPCVAGRPGPERGAEPGPEAQVRGPGAEREACGAVDRRQRPRLRRHHPRVRQAYAGQDGPVQCARSRPWWTPQARRPSTGVAKAIREVRAVMTESGYTRSDYRFILQSYGSPVPRASEARYPESKSRTVASSADARSTTPTWTGRAPRWSSGSPTGCSSSASRRVWRCSTCATSFRVARCARPALPRRRCRQPPTGATMEWARFLTLNLVQGEIQETLHPNFYAQKAVGRCLSLAWAAGRRRPGNDAGRLPARGRRAWSTRGSGTGAGIGLGNRVR